MDQKEFNEKLDEMKLSETNESKFQTQSNASSFQTVSETAVQEEFSDNVINKNYSNEEWETELRHRQEIIELREKYLADIEILLNKQNRSDPPNNKFMHPNDISEILVEFDPMNKTGLSAEQWINRVQHLSRFYGWTERESLHYAIGRLRGNAKKWFHNQESLFLNFRIFSEELCKQFSIRLDEADIHRQLSTRKKKTDETIESYFYDICQIAKNGNLSTSATIKYLIAGLPDDNVSRILALQQFDSTDEVLKQLQRFEQINLHRSQNKTSYTSPESKLNVKKEVQIKKEGKHLKEFPKIRCYNCNNHGHYASDCPQPNKKLKCNICNRTGHQESNCIRNNIAVVDQKDDFTVQIEISTDTGNSKILRGLIDTGSVINLIKINKIPDTTQIQPYIGDRIFAGINQSKLSIEGIIEIKCKINDSFYNIRYFVVPDSTMTDDIILGREFLKGTDWVSFIFKDAKTPSISEERVDLFNEILNVDFQELNDLELDVGPTLLPINDNVKSNFIIKEKFYKIIEDFKNKPIIDNPNVKCEMNIILSSDKPVYSSFRRFSIKDREIISKLVNDLMKEGIVQRSNSPYASPVVLVRKKNGTHRLCVDYRLLNKITEKDRFPLPHIEDCLNQLQGKSIFSLIDLKNGFYHIPVAKNSIKYTAFITQDGQFEFLKTPFGLSNAPAVFQRFVTDVFRSLIDSGDVIIYIDDILIATDTVENHFRILNLVFELCHFNCLQLSLNKCHFLKNSLEYLGYEIRADGISPSSKHIEAIRQYAIPKNVHELHRFVGLVSFFRKFIYNFSIISKPLYNLLKKGVDFKIGDTELKCIEDLKEKLISSPILAYFNPNAKTELHTDASSMGFGAILLQQQSNGSFAPVFYYSKRTSETERRYHSFELETLAIVYAIKRFHIYLHGIQFTIVTDCASLKHTLQNKRSNNRILRWSLLLDEYDYSIEHRSADKLRHVDALSRSSGVLAITECSFSQTLAYFQHTDETVRNIKQKLNKTNDEDSFYTIHDSLLYRKKGEKLLFYVPISLEDNVIRKFHEIGHVGINRTVEQITRSYWFPNLTKKVTEFIQKCLKCMIFQPKDGKKEGLIHLFDKYEIPFHTVHVDHLGPLELTKKGFRHILVIVDGFSKFVKFYATKRTDSKEVIKHLRHYFRQYSAPIRIVSDRATCFTSKQFTKFLKERNICHVLNATASPQSNGQVERFNRTLIPMLAKLVEHDDNKNWDSVLEEAEFAFNNTLNRVINSTPSKALFGVNQKRSNDKLEESISEINLDKRNLKEIRQNIVSHTKHSQLKSKIYADSKRVPAHLYKLGDIVLIKNTVTEAGVNQKLLPKFKGPYIVTKVLPNERYEVQDIEGQKLSNKSFKGVYASFNMKLYQV